MHMTFERLFSCGFMHFFNHINKKALQADFDLWMIKKLDDSTYITMHDVNRIVTVFYCLCYRCVEVLSLCYLVDSSNFWTFRGQDRTIVWLIVGYSCQWVNTPVFSLCVVSIRDYILPVCYHKHGLFFVHPNVIVRKSWRHLRPTLELISPYLHIFWKLQFAFSVENLHSVMIR